MPRLDLDDAEENLLGWLLQGCISYRLLEKSGLTPDLHGQYLAAAGTLNAKLMTLDGGAGEDHCGAS